MAITVRSHVESARDICFLVNASPLAAPCATRPVFTTLPDWMTCRDHYTSLSRQAAEIERLLTWHNPQNRAELHMSGEENMAAWRAQPVSEKQWHDHVRLAWDISPTLAVRLPERFKGQ